MKNLLVIALALVLFVSTGFAKSASPVFASSISVNAPEDQKKSDTKAAPEAKKDAKTSKKKKASACCDAKDKKACDAKDKKECDTKTEKKAEQK